MQTEVNKRLGRPTPTFTYLDYFTLNVRPIEPSSATAPFDVHRTAAKTYATLRADVRVFGDRSEDTFILLNHDMEFQSKGLVRLCCDAHDAIIANDSAGLARILTEFADVVERVTDAFLHSVPNAHSDHYVVRL